jgi:acyl carrier protein
MNPASENKLREIFVEILELDEKEDVSRARRIATERWDSLAQTTLIAAIESEFGLTLDIGDMERISSFAATRLLLEEKGI